MRILITGSRGQLGRALQGALVDHTLFLADLPDYDITDRDSIGRLIHRWEPQAVIHLAAWTDVDGCARNPDRAYQINALGARNVALACAAVGAELIHLSTNEVFDGRKGEPYLEFDLPNPINAYGKSKLAAEMFVQHLLSRFYIVRTAWMFAPGGHNFIHKVLQIAHQTGRVQVVTDEVGSPTYSLDLAQAIAGLLGSGAYGWYHLVNEGSCSRYAFAKAILELTGHPDMQVMPISRMEYNRPSRPPVYCALRNFVGAELGLHLRPWTEALVAYWHDHGRQEHALDR